MMTDRLTFLRVRVALVEAGNACVEEDQQVPKIVARAISSLPKGGGIASTRPPAGFEAVADPVHVSVGDDSSADSCPHSAGKDAESVLSSGVEGAVLQDADATGRLQYAGLGPVPQLKDIAGVWSDSMGHTIYVSPASPIVQLVPSSGRRLELRLTADFAGRLWCGSGALMHVGIAQKPTAGGWGVPVHLAWQTVDSKISIWDRVDQPSALPAESPAGNSSRGTKKQHKAKYPDFVDTVRAAPTPQGRKMRKRSEHNAEAAPQ